MAEYKNYTGKEQRFLGGVLFKNKSVADKPWSEGRARADETAARQTGPTTGLW